jgi:hypothetical protein
VPLKHFCFAVAVASNLNGSHFLHPEAVLEQPQESIVSLPFVPQVSWHLPSLQLSQEPQVTHLSPEQPHSQFCKTTLFPSLTEPEGTHIFISGLPATIPALQT